MVPSPVDEESSVTVESRLRVCDTLKMTTTEAGMNPPPFHHINSNVTSSARHDTTIDMRARKEWRDGMAWLSVLYESI